MRANRGEVYDVEENDMWLSPDNIKSRDCSKVDQVTWEKIWATITWLVISCKGRLE
jgi:hypothetical protein